MKTRTTSQGKRRRATAERSRSVSPRSSRAVPVESGSARIGSANSAAEVQAEHLAQGLLAGRSARVIGRDDQSRGSSGPRATTGVPASVDHVLWQQGEGLARELVGSWSPLLGRDLSPIRVHTDQPSTRELGARAYTSGTHLVFAPGEYRPGSLAGRRLIAHELAHALQYSDGVVRRTLDDGHDLHSNRFSRNIELEDVYDGGAAIEKGARGIHVVLIQQALVDAGFTLPVYGVDGKYEDETKTAVEDFQRSKGMTGAALTGKVDTATVTRLDQHFLTHAPEHTIATDPARALTQGTRSLSAAERAAVTQAITTQPQTSSGGLPTFHRNIASHSDPYETRVSGRLTQRINQLNAGLVTSRPARTPPNLLGAAEINRIAQAAKSAVDAVYGRYKTGPALAYGVNIRDQFVARSGFISASTRNADWAANFRVFKILNGDDVVKRIDREHGAVKSRAPEWALIAGITGFPNTPPGVRDYDANPPHVTTGIVGTRRADLLNIHRNWPASAGGGRIFLQRYLGSTDIDNRNLMYRLFATVIHEYIHTLEHPTHVAYRRGLPEQRGGFVLREGITDYLAKIVWDNTNFNAALRTTIEGRFQDPVNPTGHPIRTPGRYGEWVNAERMVGVVGIRNALAAFLLGRVDLIGGP